MAQKLWQALALGAMAGMRSMSAPAALSHALKRSHSPALAGSALRFMQSPATATTLKVAAVAEMAADKLPGMPDRTSPSVLGGRILSGALVGATAYKARGGRMVTGALLGGITAVAATFGAMFLRKGLDKASGLPDPVWGLVEDGLVLMSGNSLVKGFRRSKSTVM